jgi:hypothetical protein
MPVGGHYFAADAASQDELARLRLLEDECDPHTRRYLDAVGVGLGCVAWKSVRARVRWCAGSLSALARLDM